MNIKTKAIVLDKITWKESSYIATLMTDKLGIIKAIVQGAKKPKSKFFAHFELGNILEIIIIKKETTNLSKIIDSCLIDSREQVNNSYEHLLSLQITLEVYAQLYITEDEADIFFDLLYSFINFLPLAKANHLLINWRLLIKLTEYLGFPIVYYINNKYEFADPVEIKKNSPETLNNIHKWLQILPNTSQYIKQENILDKSARDMNLFILDWFTIHLHKKLKMNAVSFYEDYIGKNLFIP